MASGADELLAAFSRWAAHERVAKAAAERARTRSLSVQSARSATWVGLLVDLAERRASVSVTAGETRLTGRLVGVGRDFFVLESPGGRPVLVVTDAASSISPAPDGAPSDLVAGDRPPALDLSLLGALDALAEERAPVAIRAGSSVFDGEIVAVGADVVTIRSGGARRRTIHLVVGALSWCELR